MQRKINSIIGVMLAVTFAIAASAKADACTARPFASYIEEVQHAIDSGVASPNLRDRIADLLHTARSGSGPIWLADRQKSLNEALTAVGHKAAGEPPLAELTDGQREGELHRRALLNLGELVEMAGDATSTPEARQKLADTLVAVRRDIERGQWKSAIDRSDAVEMDLGLVLPAKCPAAR